MLFHRISTRTQSNLIYQQVLGFHGQFIRIYVYPRIYEPRVEHQDQYPDDIGVVSVRNCEQGPRQRIRISRYNKLITKPAEGLGLDLPAAGWANAITGVSKLRNLCREEYNWLNLDNLRLRLVAREISFKSSSNCADDLSHAI